MPEPLSDERIAAIRKERQLLRCYSSLRGPVRALDDLLAEVDRRIPCARCSRPILPIDSQTPENEELDVCGPCGVAAERERLWSEIDELRAVLNDAYEGGNKAAQYWRLLQKARAEIADRDSKAMSLRAPW